MPNKNLKFLDSISFKTTNILLWGALFFLFIFEYSSLVSNESNKAFFTTIVPDLSGFTTVNYKRFFGFFGGPIVLSSVSAITFIYVMRMKFKSFFFKFFTLAICIISISFSNSISGFILLFLYYGIYLSSNLLSKFRIRLPKLTLKNICLLFFIIFSFIYYI